MKRDDTHTPLIYRAPSYRRSSPMEDPREWTSEHAGHSSSKSWSKLTTNPVAVQCVGDYHSSENEGLTAV